MHNRSGEPGALASVLFVDVLDHLFPALVLEIDIDIRRFVTRRRDKSLEQQAARDGIRLRNSQTVTDDGVRRGSASLAEDLLFFCELHDFMNGQKVRRILPLP